MVGLIHGLTVNYIIIYFVYFVYLYIIIYFAQIQTRENAKNTPKIRGFFPLLLRVPCFFLYSRCRFID